MRPRSSSACSLARSGGLPGDLVRAVAASELPALERLDLWFGSSWYGADATVEDIGPVLSGGTLPRLRHLGLQNSELQDGIAAAVASAPVVARTEWCVIDRNARKGKQPSDHAPVVVDLSD